MDNMENINKNVEASLNSLDGIQQAGPGDYFFTRVMARIHRQKRAWELIGDFVARPAVAVAVICLVIGMNTWAVLEQKGKTHVFTEQSEQLIYGDETNLAARAYYDYENAEP